MTPTAAATSSLHDYRPSPGRYDECKSGGGDVRPGWTPIAERLGSLGSSGIGDRIAQVEQMVRENGATFNVESEAGRQSRPWQISPVPLLVDAESWSRLEAGLAQRTRVLEAVLNDLLGPQRLVKERVVPGELLWANPFFSRTYHGLPDTGGIRLHVPATDVARATDGSWWVTGDRSRAPSGLGYLLENRIVTSRVFPHLIRRCNVKRLAIFFDMLRNQLRSLAPRRRDNPRVALLTPGQESYRAFEDAYLARYLGLTLVQGRDLAVRGERLNLKTLGGLLPIEVLWRHISDRKCDPLELEPGSKGGVTGLLDVVRQGAVANSVVGSNVRIKRRSC